MRDKRGPPPGLVHMWRDYVYKILAGVPGGVGVVLVPIHPPVRVFQRLFVLTICLSTYDVTNLQG